MAVLQLNSPTKHSWSEDFLFGIQIDTICPTIASYLFCIALFLGSFKEHNLLGVVFSIASGNIVPDEGGIQKGLDPASARKLVFS